MFAYIKIENMKNLVLLVFVLFVSSSNAQVVHFLSDVKTDNKGENVEKEEQYFIFDFDKERYHMQYKDEGFFTFKIANIIYADTDTTVRIDIQTDKGLEVTLMNFFEADECFLRTGKSTVYVGVCRYAEKE